MPAPPLASHQPTFCPLELPSARMLVQCPPSRRWWRRWRRAPMVAVCTVATTTSMTTKSCAWSLRVGPLPPLPPSHSVRCDIACCCMGGNGCATPYQTDTPVYIGVDATIVCWMCFFAVDVVRRPCASAGHGFSAQEESSPATGRVRLAATHSARVLICAGLAPVSARCGIVHADTVTVVDFHSKATTVHRVGGPPPGTPLPLFPCICLLAIPHLCGRCDSMLCLRY